MSFEQQRDLDAAGGGGVERGADVVTGQGGVADQDDLAFGCADERGEGEPGPCRPSTVGRSIPG